MNMETTEIINGIATLLSASFVFVIMVVVFRILLRLTETHIYKDKDK